MVTKALSAKELDALRNDIFPSMPTYNAADETVRTSDVPALWQRMGRERTPEQLKVLMDFMDEKMDGKLSRAVSANIMSKAHLKGPWLYECMRDCDKNGDGFIQKEEYELIFKIFGIHNPGWKKSYADFIKEADVNSDGKVSIHEAVEWIEKQDV